MFSCPGPFGPLGMLGGADLFDNLIEGGGRGFDRRAAGDAADTPVPFSIPAEIERDDGQRLPLDVAPDVQLGEVENGVDAEMLFLAQEGFVLIPDLRRLVLVVPLEFFVRGKSTFLARIPCSSAGCRER